MKRTFEIIEKGYEYKTEGYTIKKGQHREIKVNTGFVTLNSYKWVSDWTVFPEDGKHIIYRFHTLKQAKDFIIGRDQETGQ